MHHRRERGLRCQRRDERTAPMRRLDDAARPQHLEPFAQRGARHAELDGQTPFRRQGLPRPQHAVDDQAFDALGHRVRHLRRVFSDVVDVLLHGSLHWSDHFSRWRYAPMLALSRRQRVQQSGTGRHDAGA
jgi:hypothetical protein